MGIFGAAPYPKELRYELGKLYAKWEQLNEVTAEEGTESESERMRKAALAVLNQTDTCLALIGKLENEGSPRSRRRVVAQMAPMKAKLTSEGFIVNAMVRGFELPDP